MKTATSILTVLLLGLSAMSQDMWNYSITGLNISASEHPSYPGEGIGWTVELVRAGDKAVLGATSVAVNLAGVLYIVEWETPSITEGTEVFYRIFTSDDLYYLDSTSVILPVIDGSPEEGDLDVANSSFDFSGSIWTFYHPPLVINLTVVTNTVDLNWMTISGVVYQVQAATNLNSGGWTNVGAPVVGDGQTNSLQKSIFNQSEYFRLIID